MKKSGLLLATAVCILLFLLIEVQPAKAQGVAINNTLAPANPAAGLDVDFATQGLLIPRVALTGALNFAPLAAHVAGMMVYNTATTADLLPGLYYNTGSKWIASVPLPGVAAGDLQYWNGSTWVRLAAGQTGQKLQLTSALTPAWSNGAFSTLATVPVTLITSGTASSGGTITSDGGTVVTARGVCWNTASAPTIANNKTTDGTGMGTFTSNITGLASGTTYFLRAYATNSAGTSYGNEISFVTP